MKKIITVEEAERMALGTDGEYAEEFEKYLEEKEIPLSDWDYDLLGEFFRSLGYETDEKNLIAAMREDTGMSRPQFSKTYNIPKRTLESWEWGEREAPEYVIDLLGRVVYSDMIKKKARFSVVEINNYKMTEEFFKLHTDSYIEAVNEAREIKERWTDSEKETHEVEIRLYLDNIEDEDCENYDYEVATF